MRSKVNRSRGSREGESMKREREERREMDEAHGSWAWRGFLGLILAGFLLPPRGGLACM